MIGDNWASFSWPGKTPVSSDKLIILVRTGSKSVFADLNSAGIGSREQDLIGYFSIRSRTSLDDTGINWERAVVALVSGKGSSEWWYVLSGGMEIRFW